MPEPERGTVLIQDGDDWVKVFINGELVMENHGHANDWQQLFIETMEATGADVENLFGYFHHYTREFHSE